MDWKTFERRLKGFSPDELGTIRRAFELGETLHAPQKRKSGEPYFTHPIAVAEIVADLGGDTDSIVTSLLHDAVEDTPFTIADAGREFGPAVQTLIDGLTKLSAQDIAQKPTVNEQVETLRKIFTLMRADVRIMVIKLADRLHNMSTIAALSPERQVEMARETEDVYAKFASKLCMQEVYDKLEGYCLAILEPEIYERLTAMRAEALRRSPLLLRALADRMAENPALAGVRPVYEFQTWEKQKVMLEASGSAVTGLPSHTVALVCDTVDQCYAAMGFLHQQWKREVLSFQDYINAPVTNGYRGLHTTVLLEDGTRLRCKIRTEEMHAYAHRGIAVYCFDRAAKDPLAYLPWLHRISPLAEDTKDRSQEFWNSLQNDILGKSILVYGPDNATASLPAGSTALDAAIHLLQDQAMRLESLKINGHPASFRTPMKHGESLEYALSETPLANREWLDWVTTSYATAMIRTALATLQSEAERENEGHQMLQRVMHEAKKGFIEEFNEHSLAAGLASVGYSSLRDAYLAIADGHLDPLDAYIAMFDTRRQSGRKQQCVISFFAEAVNTEIFAYLQTLEANRDSFREVRYRYVPAEGGGPVMVRMYLTAQEQNTVVAELRMRGAKRIVTRLPQSRIRFGLALATVLLVWSLDPVIAKLIVDPRVGANPVDFAIMRQVGFFLISLLSVLSPFGSPARMYHRLPKTDPLLVTAGIAFFIVGLSSYICLQGLLPQEYITIVYASSVLIPVLSPFQHLKLNSGVFGMSLVLTATGIGMLKLFQPAMPLWAFGAAIVMLLSFSVFTAAINEYQRKYHVAARVQTLLFDISMISLACCLFLLPLSTLSSAPLPLLGLMLGYGAVVIGLSYHLYYQLLFTRWFQLLGRLFPLGLALTFAGQFLVFGTIDYLSLVPFGLIVLSALLLIQRGGQAAGGGNVR